MIPPWLTQSQPVTATVPARRSRQRFISGTIEGSARFLRETLFVESWARTPGFLQSLEPRCKLAAFLILIVTASLLRTPLTVWSLYLVSLVTALVSGIRPGPYLRRAWLTVPFFSLLIILPATLNLVTPGDPLLVVWRMGGESRLGPWRLPADIAVTRQGVHLALLFVGRVAASVSLATLLAFTTRWDRLMAGLRGLGIPALFVLTVTMAYRYIFVLVTTVTDLYLARRSRTLRSGSTGQEQRWVAGRIGFVFRKSLRTGSDVHDAMISRGFGSDIRALAGPPAGWREYAGIAAASLLGIVLIAVDRISP